MINFSSANDGKDNSRGQFAGGVPIEELRTCSRGPNTSLGDHSKINKAIGLSNLEIRNKLVVGTDLSELATGKKAQLIATMSRCPTAPSEFTTWPLQADRRSVALVSFRPA